MSIITKIKNAGKKIVKNFKEIYAEKKEKFINASQQAFYLDRREAALKNLMDPKAKLNGALKRRLLEQTGRPIDASETQFSGTGISAGERFYRKISKLPMRQLHRWNIRAKHRATSLQIKYDKLTTNRNKALLKPVVERATMFASIVAQIHLFRIANVRPMPVRGGSTTN